MRASFVSSEAMPVRKVIAAIVLLVAASSVAGEEKLQKPLVTGLKTPISVTVGSDGRIYVVARGDGRKDGDSAVMVVENGLANSFATGFELPNGIVAWNEWLFVADSRRGVWRIDKKGKSALFAAADAFPTPPHSLVGITVDEEGTLYVSDTGSLKDGGMLEGVAIYRINQKGKVTLVSDARRTPGLRSPRRCLVMDGMSHLVVSEFLSSKLSRLKIADGTEVQLASRDLSIVSGLAWDRHGRLYFSGKGSDDGYIRVIPRPGEKPIQLSSGVKWPDGICLDATGKNLLVVDTDAGTLTALPINIPGHEVDETPMPLKTAVAFPDLEWTGWKPENDRGQVVPLRPLVLTHAGDGSNRVFVATQHGVIHVFSNDQKAKKTTVFLDIQDRVVYNDEQNEEGFLGLAFHPKYKENGEFFVFYTKKKAKLTNVVSRFRVGKDDPNRADPASEEVLLEIKKPFWNHDGGTLCFGPDGYLYIAHGDGGAANDPYGNGQKLSTHLGKVLRIDVDHKDEGKNYAIPKDNPFVGKPDAKPEIYAYGLRNVWRMAFDKKTGVLWASDVGQNLYEEIDHIVKGGNYGWNLREGMHPFGAKGVGPRPDLIEPIWEYSHDVGKSLTGGCVHRGKRLPELDGYYLYADYVTNKIWALQYDPAKKRVVANRPIPDPNVPVMSFGEDEMGDVYFMTYSPTGKGIYRFEKAGGGKAAK
jgi:glucose/arabinose dehydrogenase